MHKFFLTNKPLGLTPLEALEHLRREKGIGADVPMTYAGRLDPMAEGLLLILVGDECKIKDQYLGLDKEYEIEVLLGVSSDTGDVLGKIKRQDDSVSNYSPQHFSEQIIQEKITSLIGKRTEKYPAYSSKPVNGKPLFMYAREVALGGENFNDIDMPEKEIEIYSIDFCGAYVISKEKSLETVLERILKVKGDFRQEEIINSWKQTLEGKVIREQFQIIKLKVKSSSGAYMRTLAEKLGESLGVHALAWSIKRTKIGDFGL
ncbi:MAG TPA: hypothetical protein VL335_03240 [Candidatus Paceibacterota bacterium]|nr:hypothetical protein [Candidatus Paceibacterota bacterium]